MAPAGAPPKGIIQMKTAKLSIAGVFAAAALSSITVATPASAEATWKDCMAWGNEKSVYSVMWRSAQMTFFYDLVFRASQRRAVNNCNY